MSDSKEGDSQKVGPRGIVNPDVEKIVETLKKLQETVSRSLPESTTKKQVRLPRGWWWKSLLLGAVAWTVLLTSFYVLGTTPSITRAIGATNTNLSEISTEVDAFGIFARMSAIAEAIDGNSISQRGEETGNVSLVEALNQLTTEFREMRLLIDAEVQAP